jgi:Rod binding domain-containing protein
MNPLSRNPISAMTLGTGRPMSDLRPTPGPISRPESDAAPSAGRDSAPSSGGPVDKTREMTRQFEAVFVRHLLNEAQKPVHGGGALPASSSRGIYQDMMVERWADQITRSGDFGVARSLELQLRQSTPMPVSTPEASLSAANSLQ